MNEKPNIQLAKRRRRLFLCRDARINRRGYSNSLGNIQPVTYSDTKPSQRVCGKYKRNIWDRFINDTRGMVNSVEFLIYLLLILFLLFGGVDYYVTLTQHDSLEHIKDYYTDRMRIEGNLTEEARIELHNLLDNNGYKNIEINVLNNAGADIDSNDVITRDAENPVFSVMKLQIRVTPKYVPFLFGRLIGVKEDENFYFMLEGKVLSEKAIE